MNEIGEVLVRQGKLTGDQLREALEVREAGEQSLGRALVSLGYVTADDVARAIAERSGVEYVESPGEAVTPEVAGMIPEEVLTQHVAVPLRIEDGRLIVAMSNPEDLYARSDLTISAGCPVTPVVSSEEAILDLIRNGYPADGLPEGGAVQEPAGQSGDEGSGEAEGGRDPLFESQRLGDILLGMGRISREQLERARSLQQQGDRRKTGEILFSLGFVVRQDLGRALARRFRTKFVEAGDLARDEIDSEALNLIGEETLRKHTALPLRFENGRLVVAMSDPNDLQAQEDLRFVARRPISPVVATREDLQAAISRIFGPDELDQAEEASNTVVERVREPMRRRAKLDARGSRLGEVLVQMGRISQDQLEEARALQQEGDSRKLGEILFSLGYVTRANLSRALAAQLSLDFVELTENDLDRGAAEMVEQRILRRHGVMPLRVEDGRLVVAMSDPTNIYALEDLMIASKYPVTPVVALDENIQRVFNKVFAVGEGVSEILREAARDSGAESADEIDLGIETTPDEAPVVRLVSSILQQAVGEGASDIHIEPRGKEIVVRMRVDGVLRETMSIPTKLQSSVAARLKILGNLDIAERRVPQDGRFSVRLGPQKVDFRVASLPTVFGEKLVLRLIESASAGVDLKKLGFAPEMFDKYQDIFRRPYGAILVTGPTGSGKSTTLYSTLSELNSPEKNIITVEDPVESRITGVNQIQVNPKAGLTFASGLRSILRADPDIVMIGEIRDFETAKISVEAALTGHLVLATLHTNNAPGALGRLTDMGVEPFLTASAVDCVIAQRLARRLCEFCREPVELDEEVLSNVSFPFEVMEKDEHDFHRAVGCRRCGGSGYKGRVGIYELMVVNDEIRELMLKRTSTDEVASAARRAGMVPLREDGLIKAARGMTTIEEILRTVV